jgi:four helix bundle protein
MFDLNLQFGSHKRNSEEQMEKHPMNNIRRFEDIVAWQRARILTKEIYACTRVGQFARDYGLRDQIQRASVSTMANIAEGYERDGDREFLQFLSNSKGSCGEVGSHLFVALDQGYLPRRVSTVCPKGRSR